YGGIVNVNTKAFYDAHMALIEQMSEAGEPTSAPIGSRLDKRTVGMTLNNMEIRGRIKMVKTSITTPTGTTRPACVVYVPHLKEEKLASFLQDMSLQVSTPSRQTNIKKIDQQLDYGVNKSKKKQNVPPFQLLQPQQPQEHDFESDCANTA